MPRQLSLARFLLFMVAALMLGTASGCDSPQQAEPTVSPSSTQAQAPSPVASAPVAVGTQFPNPVGTAAGPPTPRPSIAPYLTPESTFHATLEFPRPLPIADFKEFVLQTRIMPVRNIVRGTDAGGRTFTFEVGGVWMRDAQGQPLTGTPEPGSDGISLDEYYMRGGTSVTDVQVLESTALMDGFIYESVKLDSRVVVTVKGQGKTATEAVVDRWKKAAGAVRTYRVTHNFRYIRPDRTPEPVATFVAGRTEAYEYPITIDETADFAGATKQPPEMRYKVTVHYANQDITTLYDGKDAYRYDSRNPTEVFSPLPESYAQNAYWIDDAGELSFFGYLYPEQVSYELLGSTTQDGRNLLELLVVSGNRGPAGISGTRVFIDEATYLPYRVATYHTYEERKDGLERTFGDLQVNVPLTNDDFQLQLPTDSVRVFEQAHWAPSLPSYRTLEEAAANAGYTLFAPAGAMPTEVLTTNYVEKDGKRTPTLFFEYGDISFTQGRYLQHGLYKCGQSVPDAGYTDSRVDIDGQTASLCVGPSNTMLLVMVGTLVLMEGFETEREAIEVVRTLLPVK